MNDEEIMKALLDGEIISFTDDRTNFRNDIKLIDKMIMQKFGDNGIFEIANLFPTECKASLIEYPFTFQEAIDKALNQGVVIESELDNVSCLMFKNRVLWNRTTGETCSLTQAQIDGMWKKV